MSRLIGRKERPAFPGDGLRTAGRHLFHVDAVAELDYAAIGQHGLDPLHAGRRVAVLERMGAGRIVPHDAAHRRPVGARRVGSDLAAGWGETLVQIVEHDARLARHGLAVNLGNRASGSGSCPGRSRCTATRRPPRCPLLAARPGGPARPAYRTTATISWTSSGATTHRGTMR